MWASLVATLIFSMSLMGLGTNIASASPDFRVFVNPSVIMVEPGQSTGNITVEIENCPELFAWELNMSWDTTQLTWGGLFTRGDFLSSQMSVQPFWWPTLSGVYDGWVYGAETGLGTDEAVGSGILAVINFTVAAQGECTIDLHGWNTQHGGEIGIFIHLGPGPGYETMIYAPEEYTLEDGAFNWPPLLGDINQDGIVNILDLVTIALAYGTSTGEPRWNPDADIAEPYGVIDIADLARCAQDFGKYL